MNHYLHHFITRFETAIHPAAGKENLQKKKEKNSKTAYLLQASPDCFHTRATARKQDNARRNPAP